MLQPNSMLSAPGYEQTPQRTPISLDPVALRRRAEYVLGLLVFWAVADLYILGSMSMLQKDWFGLSVAWLFILTVGGGTAVLRLFQRCERDTYAWQSAAASAQEEHQQMGELLRSLFETTPDAITVKDAKGRYLKCNGSALTMLGRSEFDFQGEMDEGLLPIELAAKRRSIDLRIITGESAIVFEESANLPGRGQVTWQVSVNALRDPATAKLRVIFATYKDITERKALDECVRESKEMFSIFFGGGAVGAVISDLQTGTMLEVNEAFASMLGYQRAEILGKSSVQLGIWPSIDVRQQLIQQLTEVQQVGTLETQVRGKDGLLIDVLIQGERVCLRDTPYFMGTMSDMSGIKAAQRALQEKEQQYRALFENLLVGAAYGVMVGSDQGPPDLRLIEVNSRMEELLGRSMQSLTDRPLRQVFPDLPETNPELFERVARIATHGGTSDRFQCWLPQTNRWMEFCVFEGGADSYIITADDVTEHRRYEDEILRLNDQLRQRLGEQGQILEDAVQDMETFIYTVSLRLFDALAVVKTDLSHCWAVAPTDVEFRKEIARTLRSTRYMKDLLEGAVAYLCASTLPVDTELVDVRGIITRLCADSAIRHPKITFNIQALPQVTGVPLIIHTIFHNLLENACKFSACSPSPEIEVGVLQSRNTTFYIKDNGIGFPPAAVARLFQPYEVIHGEDEGAGAGIGLAMTRRLVQRHGGTIWAEAEEGRGATFFITLGTPPLDLSPHVSQ